MSDNWIEMQVAPIVPTGTDKRWAFEAELSLNAPGNSKWILIPEDVKRITVTVIPGDESEMKVQTTISLTKNVKEDSVDVKDWVHGTVYRTVTDYCIPVTAIRCVVSSGSGKIQVRSQ